MSTFGEVATAFKQLDINQMLYEIFKSEKIQTWVRDTIQQRLFSKGETGSGNILQTDISKEKGTVAYSTYTEYLKEEGMLFEGMELITIGRQPIDRVTLLSKGDLYNSFKMIIKQKSFITWFNFQNPKYFENSQKGIYQNFQSSYSNEDEFTNDIESLTDDEIDLMIYQYIVPELMRKLNEVL